MKIAFDTGTPLGYLPRGRLGSAVTLEPRADRLWFEKA
jgi:hypothetical protein